jgi:hypothetical protein
LLMLKANLNILRQKFPEVLLRILQVGDTPPANYFYDDSITPPRLMVRKGNHSFPAYGMHKQEALIQRWFGNLRLSSEALYAITGFGDGSHVKYFIENCSKGTHVIIAEKDPALLRETFSRFDLSALLADDRFMLGTGLCNDAFFKDIQAAAMLRVSDVNSLVFSPFHSIDENYYDQARNEMVRQYLVVRPLMEVNLRTGVNLQENTLANLPYMANAPDVGELKDRFADIPFILIGAGPSLDESIDFLKKVQSKAIIVASNSPLRKLINSGIQPHLVVTADPMEPTLSGFLNVDTSGLTLACPHSAYPEIVKIFQGRILSWLSVNPIVERLKEQWGHKKGTPIMEQGTVSGCVLDLSRLLGCKKVLFIGQDMCIRADGKYYTDDSFYADSGAHYSEQTKGHKLPGNTIDSVLVEGRLYVYLKTFENFISQNSQVEYRNLARTGVKVKGAPYLTYDEALEWINNAPNSDRFTLEVKRLLENSAPLHNLQESLEPLKKYTESLLKEVLELAIETELIPEKFSGTNYENNTKVLKLLDRSRKVNSLIESNELLWRCLLDGKTKRELAYYKRIVREIEFPNKKWTALQKNKEYYWAIAEGCHWLLNTLESKLEPKFSEIP